MAQQSQYFPLSGGMDQVTPAIQKPPGRLIAGKNHEPISQGYARIRGYERFDGRPKPSEASYWVLDFDAGTAAITEGQTVTGATSAATGEALIAGVLESGSYAGSDAAGYLVLFNVVGTFQNNENLQVAAVTKCVADGVATERGATTDANDTTWIRDAIESARTDILTVTGSGVMRGVWMYNNVAYAFRNNAGGTAGGMWKSSATGWTAVSLGRTLSFTSGGVTAIAENDTITGATSAATAVVGRVILTSGTWAGGDAAGRLILTSQTGTFQAENLDVGASLNLATIAGNSTAITLPAGGKYDFTNHNFYGASNLNRMYGCNGVGTAFEFDGTVFVPILTGMTTDTPDHIGEYKNHLFLSFPGGSIQNSGTGNPYSWTAVTGATEISVGHDVTGFATGYAKSLVIFARNKICELLGNDSTDFVLETLAEDAGGIEWTIQQIGVPVYMDDRGVRDIRTTPAYGDFKLGTLTQLIEPLFKQKKKDGVVPTASMRVRAKDQYRLFFDDDSGITIYLGRKYPEAIPFDLGLTAECACSSEDSSGNEVLLFGSDDGYVYQLDAGTSLDGAAVSATMRLPFNHVGTPTRNKRWHMAAIEVAGQKGVTISCATDFDYGSSDQPGDQHDFDIEGGGGFWETAVWESFNWDAPVENVIEHRLEGIGTNASLLIFSSLTYAEPYVVHGVTLHWSDRGMKR